MKRKPHAPKINLLTPDQLQQLLNRSKDLRDQVVICLKAQAGLRHVEARHFRLIYVDWEHRLIRLPCFYAEETITNGHIQRDIPICPALFDLLLRLKNGGYPDAAPVMLPGDYRLRAIAANAGVQLPPNALRHSFATYRRQIIKSVAETAYEMGTSVSYLAQSYATPPPAGAACAWFAVKAP